LPTQGRDQVPAKGALYSFLTRPMKHNNWHHCAPELEEAVVATCWRKPDGYLAETLRQIDPETDLGQPHCRHLIKAVELCYCDLGTARKFS